MSWHVGKTQPCLLWAQSSQGWEELGVTGVGSYMKDRKGPSGVPADCIRASQPVGLARNPRRSSHPPGPGPLCRFMT